MEFPPNQPKFKPGALPLVIGLTGHREFLEEDTPIIARRIREIIRTLREQYPSTPFVMLTSLAEGADRIGAHIAIEQNMDYFVALPLEREIYSKDFHSEESKKDFNELLMKSSRWFSLPLVEGATEEGIRSQGYERDLQYAQVGAYTARYS